MTTNKWDLTYSEDKIWNKRLFVFVNHKVATLCWAILKEQNGPHDVISFDSHRDYRGGVILQREATNESIALPAEKRCFSSKYNADFPHFSTSQDFIDWNLLDETKNSAVIGIEHKYFLPMNDNFIDVAFMKGLIRNVYCFYHETRNHTDNGKCDDVFGRDHVFRMLDVKHVKKPHQKFILDIDLDFFVKYHYESDNPGYVIIPEPDLGDYLNIIKSLAEGQNCIGITIALEPDCCGSEENCMKICELISEAFDKDIVSISRHRLRGNYHT